MGEKSSIYDKSFPTYPEASSKREAIGMYWDEYAKESRRLANTYPENVAIFQFPDLFKSLEMQEKMLTFVGIPRDVQVLGPLERVNSKEFRDKIEKKKAALLRITTQNIPSDSGDVVRHEKKKSYKGSKFAPANRKGSA